MKDTTNSNVADWTWAEEFDKRFFNPSIPNPTELKKFIRETIKEQTASHTQRIRELVLTYKRGEHKKLLAALSDT